MENLKIWLIADTHFGCKGDDDGWLEDYIGYFEHDLIPIMKEKVGENDILVHCGDVFDNRANIGINTINRVISLFEKFSDIFNDIRVIVGNHDMAKKSTTEITSVNVLKYIPKVKIYYEPVVEVISGKSVLFNPWIEDVEKEKEVLAGVNVNYIFGHLMIGGTQMSDRSGSKNTTISGVGVKDFKSSQVYAGHVHIRQDNGNIHYIGSPYHKDRGDRNNDKGITVLDIKTGETEFIENKVSPRYIEDNIYDILNLTINDLKERWNNNRVDLLIKGSDYSSCNFDALRDCLCKYYKEFNPKGDNNKTELKIECDTQTFDTAKTSDEYLDEFLKSQDLEESFVKLVMEKIEQYKERM